MRKALRRFLRDLLADSDSDDDFRRSRGRKRKRRHSSCESSDFSDTGHKWLHRLVKGLTTEGTRKRRSSALDDGDLETDLNYLGRILKSALSKTRSRQRRWSELDDTDHIDPQRHGKFWIARALLNNTDNFTDGRSRRNKKIGVDQTSERATGFTIEGRTSNEARAKGKEVRIHDGEGNSGYDTDSAHSTSSSDSLAQKTTDAHNWPQGNVKRRCPLGMEKQSQLGENKWAWRSTGNIRWNGRYAETRKCLGVFQCTNESCTRPVRPPTTTEKNRKAKVAEPCSVCGSNLEWLGKDCPGRAYRYSMVDPTTGKEYAVWEHDGHHTHPRPPFPGLTSSEKRALDAQVLRKPEATPHQLRTGDRYPGSVPLHGISPSLADSRRARYHVSQSRERLGITSGTSFKGAHGLVQAFASLNESLGEEFLVSGSLTAPVHIMYQTQYMKDILFKAVEDWASDSERAEGRNGFVTDGNHTYFQDGILLATCVFNTTILSWVPVLLTWIHKRDHEAHLPHFRMIANQVVDATERLGIELKPEYLLHVMDFSGAQSLAHETAFVEARIRAHKGWNSLVPEAQNAQKKVWLAQAAEARVGCGVHFERSAHRLESTHSLVPPDLASDFRKHIRKLTSHSSTEDEVDESIRQLKSSFPRISSWLKWWLQPSVASMIFPAKSKLAEDTWEKVPGTSNPVEHYHSLLNDAVGKDNDLLEGAKKIFLHVKELEAKHQAVRAGEANPIPPRNPRTRRSYPMEPNDGRAPDTVQLIAADAASREPQNPHGDDDPVSLYAYKWNGINSCFWDHSLELWFRAYLRWSDKEDNEFRATLDPNTFLGFLFHHFYRRRKLIYATRASERTPEMVIRELDLGQKKTEHYIFSRWKLLPKGSFGTVSLWLMHAIKDANTDTSIQAHFGIQQLAQLMCSHGHHTTIYSPATPRIPHTVYVPLVHALTLETGKEIPFEQYLSRLVPQSASGHALHLDLPTTPCSRTACTMIADLTGVLLSWPKVLFVGIKNVSADTSTRPRFTNTVRIRDSDGSYVTYELVGRALYSSHHFTSEIRYQGRVFTYDDIISSNNPGPIPQLQEVDDSGLLERTNGLDEVPLYVYHRTSAKATTMRAKVDIEQDWAKITSLPKAEVDVDAESSSTDSLREDHSKANDDSNTECLDRSQSSVDGSSYQPSNSSESSDTDTVSEDDEFTDNAGDDASDNQGSHLSPSSPPETSGSLPSTGSQPPFKNCTNRTSDNWCGIDEDTISKLDHLTDEVPVLITCGLCLEKYHSTCIKDSLPSGWDPLISGTLLEDWCCDKCILPKDSQWDKLLIGQFILINAVPYSMGKTVFYPAQILRRSGHQVWLQWHEFNDYRQSNTAPPSHRDFTLTAIECFRAKRRSASEYGLLHRMGFIRIPPSHHYEAHDGYDYRNGALIEAMEHAIPVIMAITVTRTVPHPITQIYDRYSSGLTKRGIGSVNAFEDLFAFPLFIGDSTLTQSVLLRFEKASRNERPNDTRFHDAVHLMAMVLLKVVMTRVVMKLMPCHDILIFYLACSERWVMQSGVALTPIERAAASGYLKRRPSIHEQALASGFPDPFKNLDTAVQHPNKTLSQLRTVVDSTLDSPSYEDFPINAFTNDDQEFFFPMLTGEGLNSGTSSFHLKYTPSPSSQLPIQQDPATTPPHSSSRPKPRPRASRGRHTSKGSSIATASHHHGEYRILEPPRPREQLVRKLETIPEESESAPKVKRRRFVDPSIPPRRSSRLNKR